MISLHEAFWMMLVVSIVSIGSGILIALPKEKEVYTPTLAERLCIVNEQYIEDNPRLARWTK